MNIYDNEPGIKSSVPHYYGDVVRTFFIIGGVVMIVTLPVFADRIPVSFQLSLLAILVVGFLAGLTNPRHVWVMVINALVSAVAFFDFEYYAVSTYSSLTLFSNGFFWINQILAIDFFLALYYSAKTIRGFYLRSQTEVRKSDKK